MDEAIIKNHNLVVKPNDTFYYLGDLVMNDRLADGYLSRLNGIKYFIRGNHDNRKTIAAYEKYGTYLGELKEVKVNDQRITLCHYAMRVWNQSHRGTWQLYGHSHHSLWDDPNALSIDVGVNGHGYFPIEFKTIEKIMSKKTYKSIDHHKFDR